MKFGITTSVSAILLAATTFSSPVLADQTIKCKSEHFAYHQCRIDTHGYVRLSRQLSKTHCRQGSNWDYDRRGIWVDDGCAAEFVVESRQHTSDHSDHNGTKAVAAAAAIALIAAAASANHDKHDRYNDNDYSHGGHSSYVPGWMVGDFSGYNMQYGSDVDLHISSDGRVSASVNGARLSGYVNDERLYIGDLEFYIDRAGDGFNSVQVSDRSNKVHYIRR